MNKAVVTWRSMSCVQVVKSQLCGVRPRSNPYARLSLSELSGGNGAS